MTKKVALALALLTAAFIATPAAQQTFNLRDAIPFDAAVRTGALPNGLRFFIRHNERPAQRVSLRLAVKAGSLYEADDQQGLAHFIEHMAFNGSAHFKPGELVSYFESTGARLGPHVNAYTSFDETVYMLDLPTDRSDVVVRGLSALADFAGGLTLSPTEVDKERGVVIEEWRGGLGAGTRIRDRQIPALYYQSRYADRIPIGKPEIIRAAPTGRLRAFYDTWYRPERMAVVVVGDVDAQQIETTIRLAFGPLGARAPAAPEPSHTMPLHQQLLVSVAADSEITQSSVQLVHKGPKGSTRLVGDYRRDVIERLFTQMLNERFGELARKPDARFIAAGAGGGSLGPQVETFSLSARVIEGRLLDGLAALAIEERRVREFGFTPPELDRARRSLMAYYERAYNERDKNDSGAFAQEYLSYFLVDEPSPGIDYEHRLVQQLLPGITLADVTQQARASLADTSRVVLAVAPEKAALRLPVEAELRTALANAVMVAVMPWTDTTASRELLVDKPSPASIASRREQSSLGVTIVRFPNGLEAWLKPTDFQNDQVLFTMYAPGGAALASPADFLDASLAAVHVARSGVDGLSAIDLNKLLAGKIVRTSPSISLSTHGISGAAAPADLETALQLLYQQFRAPGDDAEEFSRMQRQLEAQAANRGNSPGQVFAERVEQVNTSSHYTSEPLTPERVRALDRAKMLTFYRERFANAGDFTFFMVGAFKVETVMPLLGRYLGSLPGHDRPPPAFKDLGIHFPSAIERARVEKGREPKSQTAISFFADPPPDPMEQEKLGAATTVLQTTLRDLLREDLGQTYNVGVGMDQPLHQRGAGHIQISFGAAPENIDAMAARVLQEVKRLQEEGPSLDLTARAKESAKRTYETSLRQNGSWLRRLEAIHELGWDPEEILRRPERIDRLTPEILKETFKTYFPLDRYTVVTLMPERR